MKEDILSTNLVKPTELKHNNEDYPLVDDSQIGGGYRVLNNKYERNSLPFDKRRFGTIKYRNSQDNTGKWVQGTFIGPDCTDVNWTNDSYWEVFSLVDLREELDFIKQLAYAGL